MPELPEVETIRRQLDRELVRQRIVSAEVLGMRAIRRHGKRAPFRNGLEGHVIMGTRRKGKYILLPLESGDVLAVHLGMSGRLQLVRPVRVRTKVPAVPAKAGKGAEAAKGAAAKGAATMKGVATTKGAGAKALALKKATATGAATKGATAAAKRPAGDGPKRAMRTITTLELPPVVKHTHVILTFPHGEQLRFIDPRTFGEMFVASPESINGISELAHLGFDPLDELMQWTVFAQRLLRHSTMLKPLLMDQTFVAGIGNLYSDEILFEAGLRYDRPASSLTTQEIRRLYRSMVEVLAEAVKQRGSSLADETYVDLYGKAGEFQTLHQVYAREGQPCRRCRGTIARVKLSGRSAYLCPSCQI